MQITQIQDPTLMWGENQSVQQIRNFLFSSKQFLKLEKFSGREGDPVPAWFSLQKRVRPQCRDKRGQDPLPDVKILPTLKSNFLHQSGFSVGTSRQAKAYRTYL